MGSAGSKDGVRSTEDWAMSKIEGFERLAAWQKDRNLTRKIYEITRPGALAKDFGLFGQIHRAPVSIMSNVAGGIDIDCGQRDAVDREPHNQWQ